MPRPVGCRRWRNPRSQRGGHPTHKRICRMAPNLPKMSYISSVVMLKGRFLHQPPPPPFSQASCPASQHFFRLTLSLQMGGG